MTFPARIGLVGLICCAAATAWGQQTVYVNGTTGDNAWDGLCEEWDGATCGPKATIQAGIDATVDGDTVIVADGTYTGDGNRDLIFGGRAITVRSASRDPALCVIDCEDDGRGFYFHNGEGTDSVVTGFTITNGAADEGGGALCESSSPTFDNCVFAENAANVDSGRGGGLCSWFGSSTVLNDCTFSGNSAAGGGGAYYSFDSRPEVTGCTFVLNDAQFGGGIIIADCTDSDARLVDCTFESNTASEFGGGAHIVGASPTISGCLFRDNSAVQGGGGMVNEGDNTCPTVVGCTFEGNLADFGAGMLNQSSTSDLKVISCTFSGNAAAETGGGGGGGMVNQIDSNPSLINCTFCGNSGERGGGVCNTWNSSPTLTNCILWGNVAAYGAQVLNDSSTATFRYCNIGGSGGSESWDPSLGTDGGGNIDADPLFVDPDGPDDDPATWEDNDYHLAAGSPCVDAGDPAFVPLPGETDMDGQARVWDGDGDGVAIVDMGADEAGSFIFADMNCDGLLNAFDIDAFAKALAGINEDPPFATYYEAHPDCDPWLADCNGDGLLNAFDIDPFVKLLSGC